MSTMPAPPPNGASSTLRCGSVVPDRRSCTSTSSTPLARALPSRLLAANASTMSGKIVNTSIRTVTSWSGSVRHANLHDLDTRCRRLPRCSEVEEALGRIDGDGPLDVVGDEHHGDEGSGVEHQQVGGGVGLHLDDLADGAPVLERDP